MKTIIWSAFPHTLIYLIIALSVKVIPEAKNTYTRLPLVEIPPSEAPAPPVSQQQQDTITGDEEQQTAQTVNSPTASVTAAATPKAPPKTPDIIMTEEGR